jgi:hypothetical protein
MRRALVLTHEAARHPFRSMLPPSAFEIGEAENRRSWRLNFGLDANDLRQVAMTYSAGFIATTAFFF